MATYYPERANRNDVEGKSTFRCSVTARGQLVNCVILSETPADMNFGDATLRLTKLFKLRPMTKDGTPVDGGTFTSTIVWKLPQE